MNLLPYFQGKQAGRPRETLYWRFGEQWAIRHGDWKLVVSRGGSGKPELYNLAEDRNETTDRAAEHPDTAATLQKMWDQWSAQQAPPSSVDQPATPKKNKAKKKVTT